MYIAAIDPGKSNGGIAVWNGTTASCKPTEANMDWYLETFEGLKQISSDFIVCIEKPSLHLRQIKKDQETKEFTEITELLTLGKTMLQLFTNPANVKGPGTTGEAIAKRILELTSIIGGIDERENNSQIPIIYRLLSLFESSWCAAHAAHAFGFTYCFVQPRSWQSFLQLGKVTGETDTERKRRYRNTAKRIYPQLNITTKTQDAVLMVEFMRRRMKIDPSWFNGKMIYPKRAAALSPKLF